jgi:hypothetical protein
VGEGARGEREGDTQAPRWSRPSRRAFDAPQIPWGWIAACALPE